MSKDNKPITRDSQSYLIVLIPIAILIGVISMIWRELLLGLLAIYGWHFWSQQQQQKQASQAYLKELFYELIRENQGCVTHLDWAIKANLPSEKAREYLKARAEEFSAELDLDERGARVYVFSMGRSPHPLNREGDRPPQQTLEVSPIVVDEPPFEKRTEPILVKPKKRPAAKSNPIVESSLISIQPLIQSELAKRLKVHPSTVSKKKIKPDFPEWSRRQDPEGIAWKYLKDEKQFFPFVS